jgi:hypothetical protein
MAQPKFTLYKYVKLQGGWKYCKAVLHENVKIKPNIVIVGKDKHEEKHPEGSERREDRHGRRLIILRAPWNA